MSEPSRAVGSGLGVSLCDPRGLVPHRRHSPAGGCRCQSDSTDLARTCRHARFINGL